MAICSHYKVLPTSDEFKKLSWPQKLVLHQGIVDYNKRNSDTITAIIETLKPWLNTEAYFKIKEQKENQRHNVKWDVKNA